jgi:hypothetical protein
MIDLPLYSDRLPVSENTIKETLAFAELARSRRHITASVAAYRFVVANKPDEKQATNALLDIAKREGFFETLRGMALEIVKQTPLQVFEVRFAALFLERSGDLLGAERWLRDGVMRFTDEFEIADHLSSIALTIGDATLVMTAVELAIARGMSGRDNVIWRGVTAAIALGHIDKARIFAKELRNPFNQATFSKLIDDNEAAWSAALDCTNWDVRQVVDHANVPEPTHRYFACAWIVQHLRGNATETTGKEIKSFLHKIGNQAFIMVTARILAEKFPHAPWVRRFYAEMLMQAGDVPEAGRLLLSCDASTNHDDYFIRIIGFARSRGGLTNEQMQAKLEELRPYVKNHDVVTFMLGASAEHSAAPIEASFPRFYVHSPSDRPRLAVCVSGQMRGFRRTWKITRAALAQFEPIVFVSSWEKTGVGFGAQRKVTRFLTHSVTRWFGADMHDIDLFKEALPTCFARMNADGVVTVAELQETYGTPHVIIRDEAAFEAAYHDKPGLYHRNNLNQAKMFFGIHDANCLRRDYQRSQGMVFDLVLRTRPDRPLLHLSKADTERALAGNVLVLPATLVDGVDDQLAICSAAVADIYGAIWPCIEAAGSSRWRPGAAGVFNEPLLAEFMCHHGIQLCRMDGSNVPPVGGMEIDVSEFRVAVEADLRLDISGSEIRTAFAVALIEAMIEQKDVAGAKSLFAALHHKVGDHAASLLHMPASRQLLGV